MLQLRQRRLPKLPAWIVPISGILLCAVGLVVTVRHVQIAAYVDADFTQDYYAARALLNGESIYGPTIPDPGNNHPPLMALVALPFALLPYPTAFHLWAVLSAICYIGSIVWVVRAMQIRVPLRWAPLLLGGAICWYPFIAHMALGQVSIVLLLCLVAAWASLRAGRDGLAGSLLGLATALKAFPALAAVVLLWRRKWKALAGFVLAALLLFMLPMVLVAPSDFVTYVRDVTPANTARFAVLPINVSITGIVSRLLVDGAWVKPVVEAPGVARALILVISALVLAILLHRLTRLPDTPEGDTLGLAYACIGMLLLSPITWLHAYCILLLPFGLLLRALQNGSQAVTHTALLLAFTLLSLPDIELARAMMQLYAPYQMSWYASFVVSLPVAGMVLLWVLLDRRLAEVRAA